MKENNIEYKPMTKEEIEEWTEADDKEYLSEEEFLAKYPELKTKGKTKRVRTSIMVFKDTKEILRKLKEHPKESFDECLNRLFKEETR